MNITKVRIANILGIQEIEFDAGQFNVISGKNGLGKTSFIEAIKSAFQGGNDVTLIRKGSAQGEVGLELSDGTQIIKRFADKADLKVIDSAGKEVKKPAGYLDKLADMISINPVSFLNADKKNRTNILLEALPLKINKSDLSGIDTEYYDNINLGFLHALEALEAIRKVIFDERTGVNRVVKDKDATVKELQVGLNNIDFDPTLDYSAKIEELEKMKVMMENKLRSIIDEFEKGRNEDIERVQVAYYTTKDRIESEYQTELAKLQAKRDEQLNSARVYLDTQKDEINNSINTKIQSRKDAYSDKYNPLITQLASAREKHKLLTGYQKQNDMINKFVADREEFALKAASLTEQLATLEEIKTNLLSKLPIDGLEIIDGQIYRNGIIFDRLNTAQQIEIAIEIAKLRAGELGVICVDGLERFDDETFSAFKEKAEQSNLQMFVTKVGDGSLKINGQSIN